MSKFTRIVILLLIAAAMLALAWWMNRGCPDTCRLSYATAEGYNDLVRSEGPLIVAAPIQASGRAFYLSGFSAGLDCYQEALKANPYPIGLLQFCREQKWSELKAEMEK